MHITSNSVLPPLVTLTPMLTSVLTPYLKSGNVLSTSQVTELYYLTSSTGSEVYWLVVISTHF